MIAGLVFAYPRNVWMVAHLVKHGLMTERKPLEAAEKPGGRALGA